MGVFGGVLVGEIIQEVVPLRGGFLLAFFDEILVHHVVHYLLVDHGPDLSWLPENIVAY
jgi:hypothetical protein